MRAGAFGGARVGKLWWLKILMITAGSSMAARMVKGPPHWEQVVMSMENTRLSMENVMEPCEISFLTWVNYPDNNS